MERELKPIFISKNKADIKKLCNKLKKIFNVNFTIEKYFEHWVLNIKSQNPKYIMALFIGNLIAINDKLEVCWIDCKGKQKKLDRFCICNIYEKDLFEKHDILLSNLRDFVTYINQTFNIFVDLEYNSSSKKFEIYIKLTDLLKNDNKTQTKIKVKDVISKYKKFQNELRKSVKDYIISRKHSNIFYIELLDFSGNIVVTNYMKLNKKTKAMQDYFINSSLGLGLFNPTSKNISPKLKNKEDYENSKILYCKYGVLEFETTLKKYENFSITFFTKCVTNFIEKYKLNYIDDSTEKFEMKDEYDITTKVQKVDECKLIVESKVSVSRSTNGKVANNNTVYDALIPKLSHNNCENTFEIVDYYEIIGVNLLLHYTNSTKYYEIFEIPIGFKLEDGIEQFKNNFCVYDDSNANWICYEDISEVKEYLLTKIK